MLDNYRGYSVSGKDQLQIAETSPLKNYFSHDGPFKTDTIQYAVRAVSIMGYLSKPVYSKTLITESTLPQPLGGIRAFISGKSIIYLINENIKSIRIYRPDEKNGNTVVG